MFGFLNVILLTGLAAVAIPIIIHLVNRRRYVVVDWGAMQFLQISRTTRRRIFLEELLLLLLRMGTITVFVLALAGPIASGPLLDAFASSPPRDVVLILDGSGSMSLEESPGDSLYGRAKQWIANFVGDLPAGDSVALIVAGEEPAVVSELTPDGRQIEEKLASLPAPRGTGAGPQAVRAATQLLAAKGKQPQRDIIVLSDQQRQGWADDEALRGWERLRQETATPAADDEMKNPRPRIQILSFRADLDPKDKLPNFYLGPLTANRNRTWPGQTVKFAADLKWEGDYRPPWRIRFEADGKPAGELPVPEQGKGRIPLQFSHQFRTPGPHVVSLIVEGDLPLERRPPDYQVKDRLPADNRQDFAVDVLDKLSVLLVDGDSQLSSVSTTYFLQRALEGTNSAISAKALPVREFAANLLRDRPQVVVLADVPDLTGAHEKALEDYLSAGGAILVVLGSRVESALERYNQNLHRDGGGWLPARLIEAAAHRAKPEQAASPDVRRFLHPALDIFRAEPKCSLDQARFPRWWKLAPRAKAQVAASLTSGDPWLVEQPFAAGRVLVCATPLDRSWDSNLPTVWEYPVLIQELVTYLAAAGIKETGARPGLVRPDPRESDLTPCSEDDRRRVSELVPMEYVDGLQPSHAAAGPPPQDLWWVFMIAVVLLLCGEVWLTRRLAGKDA